MRRTFLSLLLLLALAAPAQANTLQGVGSNSHRALGVGYLSAATYPAQTVQLPQGPAAFSSSTALLANGELLSWGGNAFGQVGDGRQWIEAAFPVLIAANVVQASGTCALTASNEPLGWGANTYGQAGQGVKGGGTEQGGIQTAVTTPMQIKGLPAGQIKELVCTGAAHYALYANGNLYGWGNNSQGQLGGAPQLEVLKPRSVATGVVEATFDGAAKFEGTLLMRHADGSVWSLGSSNHGQAGIGKVRAPLTAPTRVKLSGPAARIANSQSNGIALLANGTVEGWGRQDGTGADMKCGNVRCHPSPRPVPAAKGASSVAAGFSTGYAVVGGKLVSWGLNDQGQADAPPSPGLLSPAVRASGVVRVVAQQAGALLETTAGASPPVITGAPGPGRAITVKWSGGSGSFNIGLTECTGGPKERSTKSHSVGRTEAHEATVPVPHTGEWEVSIANTKTFPRKTVRVTVVGGKTVAKHHRHTGARARGVRESGIPAR